MYSHRLLYAYGIVNFMLASLVAMYVPDLFTTSYFSEKL